MNYLSRPPDSGTDDRPSKADPIGKRGSRAARIGVSQMVDAVQPRRLAIEGISGEMTGSPSPIATLRAFARRLLLAMQESQRPRAAIVVRESAHLVPPSTASA